MSPGQDGNTAPTAITRPAWPMKRSLEITTRGGNETSSHRAIALPKGTGRSRFWDNQPPGREAEIGINELSAFSLGDREMGGCAPQASQQHLAVPDGRVDMTPASPASPDLEPTPSPTWPPRRSHNHIDSPWSLSFLSLSRFQTRVGPGAR